MLTSIITHDLRPAGLVAFDPWFARVCDLLRQQSGFVSAEALADPALPSLRIIILRMKSAQDLSRWRSGEDKAALLDELTALAHRPWHAQRLTSLGARVGR